MKILLRNRNRWGGAFSQFVRIRNAVYPATRVALTITITVPDTSVA
jgi:hypothetical protein